ncbi:hypothetical protein [Methylobacterium frigidaeris]|uniref:Uncharacterized protein n=1 Tax=Methylobacterium frigidaeris TaxID=2038277 RepID=A0AA37HHS5_9HYPH|nr:hypothetical protein [Methylobacterium frigidaeris]PIK72353.1 hypothetical protein CS379_14420 [Methylobacterium frigidaeris]GJD65781.1 hypothetical protein MPEAHAMD_5976 [Methylobacterium frigidaeris]
MTDHETYVRHCLDHIASLADQAYEDMTGDWRETSEAYELLKVDLARHERERAAWRVALERDYLDPLWRRLVDAHLDGEARKAARPALWKPLSPPGPAPEPRPRPAGQDRPEAAPPGARAVGVAPDPEGIHTLG